MKRTCLQKSTTCPDYSGKTDSLSRNYGKQIACEFSLCGGTSYPVVYIDKTINL
jgi:hypothetical protein